MRQGQSTGYATVDELIEFEREGEHLRLPAGRHEVSRNVSNYGGAPDPGPAASWTFFIDDEARLVTVRAEDVDQWIKEGKFEFDK